MALTDELIIDSLRPYGLRATPEFCSLVRSYIEILLRWNKQIPLTTVTNLEEILRFHFGESIFAATAIPIERGRLADVGSGAGFPGLPIKMVRPEMNLILIESNSRKTVFLREAIRVMAIGRVEVMRSRMEELSAVIPPFDFITARAVGDHVRFLMWANGRLSPQGRVILWLGEEDAQFVSNATGWKWAKPLHIPGSKKRYILQGTRSN